MNTITFTCETITPMFLSGADGQTPELRPPSIKGALRFWWRAMNGHLSLTQLKEYEGKIFGGTEADKGQGKSKVIVRCEQKDFNLSENEYRMIAHKGGNSKCFETAQEIKITLSLTQNVDLGNDKSFNFEKLQALFEVFCYLGGLGKRNRRGNGGLKITHYKINEEEIQPYTQLDFGTTLVHKLNLVCLDNSTVFSYNNTNKIIATFSNSNQLIPNIISIEKIVKENDSEKNRELISKSTHNVLLANGLANNKPTESKNGYTTIPMRDRGGLEYTKYVGNGSRFASPIIFSVLNDIEIIVTKLKTIKEINGVATRITNSSCSTIQEDLITEVKNITL